jgi:uncharacterized protein (TIGR00730 family)
MPVAAAPVAVAGDAPKPLSGSGRAPEIDADGHLILYSLQDLHLVLQGQQGSLDAAGFFYDGARGVWRSEFPAAVSAHAPGKPGAVAGMNGVAARRVPADPSVGTVPEFAQHEIDTIRKIQVYAKDLSLLVRESAATPDLLVDGVVTELKTVHKGKLERQLVHANGQLLSHAKRHALGLGAVVLDVIGEPLTTADIEAQIASALRVEDTIGFDRVYVFQGDALQTFTRDAQGAFKLDAAVKPFTRAAAPAPVRAPVPEGALSFIPSALANAVLPNAGTVMREIHEPSMLLKARGIEATITMYGSARILPPDVAQQRLADLMKELGGRVKGRESKERVAAAREAVRMSAYYQIARELGALIAHEGGGKVAVVTGGGPGIMEGGNRGAFEAGGPSVGYNIKLQHEQNPNPYATEGLSFDFENFSTRKMALRHGSMGLVYFPGGFGTMDELFEVLTLMQTGKMPRVPIVLMGEKAYWDKILDFTEFDHMGLISHADLKLFVYAETAQQAWSAIRAAHTARP